MSLSLLLQDHGQPVAHVTGTSVLVPPAMRMSAEGDVLVPVTVTGYATSTAPEATLWAGGEVYRMGTAIIVPDSDVTRNKTGITNVYRKHMERGERLTLLEAVELLIQHWEG